MRRGSIARRSRRQLLARPSLFRLAPEFCICAVAHVLLPLVILFFFLSGHFSLTACLKAKCPGLQVSLFAFTRSNSLSPFRYPSLAHFCRRCRCRCPCALQAAALLARLKLRSRRFTVCPGSCVHRAVTARARRDGTKKKCVPKLRQTSTKLAYLTCYYKFLLGIYT